MLSPARLLALYRLHFQDHRRERMFLASICFLATFALARAVTHLGRSYENPIAVIIGDTHVHHLVWGILLLLGVGYLWLIQVGTGVNGESVRYGRWTALLYGAAAALTLDEFALWLHLEDVYWEQAGRASIDAVMVFGAFISAGLWGGPFLRAIGRQLMRPFRRTLPLTEAQLQALPPLPSLPTLGALPAIEVLEEAREPALEQ